MLYSDIDVYKKKTNAHIQLKDNQNFNLKWVNALCRDVLVHKWNGTECVE